MKIRRHCRSLVAIAPLAGVFLLGSAAASQAKSQAPSSSANTKVVAVVSAALIEVSPGLCAPFNPLCINAPQDQVHIYSQACSAAGTFEGHQLPPGTPCGINLTAFMDPSNGFPTPSCVTTHTHTSDKATAFGKPVNAVTIGGISRHLELSYPYGAAASRTATGTLKGPDHNPADEHRLVFSAQIRPHQGAPPVCITTPFTGGDVTGVMHITDLPPQG